MNLDMLQIVDLSAVVQVGTVLQVWAGDLGVEQPTSHLTWHITITSKKLMSDLARVQPRYLPGHHIGPRLQCRCLLRPLAWHGWCVIMMCHDDVSWWCVMRMCHNDLSWWCIKMMCHNDVSWVTQSPLTSPGLTGWRGHPLHVERGFDGIWKGEALQLPRHVLNVRLNWRIVLWTKMSIYNLHK